MTRRSDVEDDLAAWLQGGPTEAPAPLLNDIVRAFPAIGQRRGRRLFAWSGHSILSIAQAAAGLALVVVVIGAGVIALGSRPGDSGTQLPPAGASVRSAAPTASETTEPSTSPAGALASATASAPAATETQSGPVVCGPANVRARIASWDGAMGQRIASVELANTSATPCTIRARSRPQLVDGRGGILIDSAAAAPSAVLTVGPGGKLHTLVEDGNYCGAPPTAPISIAFVLGAGDRIIASPVTSTDLTLPPCNGSTVPATIQMQPWAP